MTDDRLHRCAYCGAGFGDLDTVLKHQDGCDEAPDHIRIQGMVSGPKQLEDRVPKQKDMPNTPYAELVDLAPKKFGDIQKLPPWEGANNEERKSAARDLLVHEIMKIQNYGASDNGETILRDFLYIIYSEKRLFKNAFDLTWGKCGWQLDWED